MNTFTQGVWEVIEEALIDDEALRADLKHLLLKDYRPFLTAEQSEQVYRHTLHAYFCEKLEQWYDWLPNATIHLIGGEVALEAFNTVEWAEIAQAFRHDIEKEQSACRR